MHWFATFNLIATTLLVLLAAVTGQRAEYRRNVGFILLPLAMANYSLALILFDLDHFKALNDTRGHQAGDEVLKAVARCAEALSRRGDPVTVSLVIALTDSENGFSPAELIQQADQALYRAKHSGRNTVEASADTVISLRNDVG